VSAAELDLLARAYLLTVRTPGDPEVTELVAAHGPVMAAELVAPSYGLSWQDHAASTVAVTRAADLRLVVPGDPEWPAAELDIVGLWASGGGRLGELAGRAVGIAGSSKATPYGLQIAARMARELAKAGWTVVTLGRFGIDGAAVRGALRYITAAADLAAYRAGSRDPLGVEPFVGRVTPPLVLPLGRLSEPQPVAHDGLFRRLRWDGLLVSEHGTRLPDEEPATDLHRQGQLMAALVRALVLVEPGWGSRWLVDAAETAGVPVLAVPGPVGSQQSQGANELIQAGRARLVTSYSDVLAELEGSRR
jgi:DNA processing protein